MKLRDILGGATLDFTLPSLGGVTPDASCQCAVCSSNEGCSGATCSDCACDSNAGGGASCSGDTCCASR